MTSKEDYLQSLGKNDLQRLILSNLDLSEEELIEKCIEFLKGDNDAED